MKFGDIGLYYFDIGGEPFPAFVWGPLDASDAVHIEVRDQQGRLVGHFRDVSVRADVADAVAGLAAVVAEHEAKEADPDDPQTDSTRPEVRCDFIIPLEK